MDFLALINRAKSKCRIGGAEVLVVTGQNAEITRLINFVNEAWMEIQRAKPRWIFMRASATCPTVQAQYAYTPMDFGINATFGYWALDYSNGDTFRNYDTASGIANETFMSVVDYDTWRNTYLMGANRSTYTRPWVVARAPDNTLVCGPIPSAGYTLVGDYYRRPIEMTTAGEVPVLPEQFHMAIVYKAMMYYGASEAAPEIYDDGREEYVKIMRQIAATQLQRTTLGSALC